MRALSPCFVAVLLIVAAVGCQPKTSGTSATAAADSARVADSLATLAKLELGQRTYLAAARRLRVAGVNVLKVQVALDATTVVA